jgi:hypothetical protein
MFFLGKISGIIHQGKASLFEIDPLSMSQPSGLCFSNFINASIQVMEDMEVIKDQGGLRGMLLNRRQIGSPLIQTNSLKPLSPPFSQPLEEPIMGLLFPAQPHPHLLPSFPIVNRGKIAMPFLFGYHINTEDMEWFDLPQFQSFLFLNDPFDHRSNHLQILSKGFSYFLERQFLGQQNNDLSCSLDDHFPYSCLENFFYLHSKSWAKDSKGTIDDPEEFISEREVSPTPFGTFPLGHLRVFSTTATPQTTVSQTIYPCYPSLFGLDHLCYSISFDSQTFSDISLYTHHLLTSFPLMIRIKKFLSEFTIRFQFPSAAHIFHDHFLEKNQFI